MTLKLLHQGNSIRNCDENASPQLISLLSYNRASICLSSTLNSQGFGNICCFWIIKFHMNELNHSKYLSTLMDLLLLLHYMHCRHYPLNRPHEIISENIQLLGCFALPSALLPQRHQLTYFVLLAFTQGQTICEQHLD